MSRTDSVLSSARHGAAVLAAGRPVRGARPAGRARLDSVAGRVADRIDAVLLALVEAGTTVAELGDRARGAGAPAFVPAIEVVEGRIGRLRASGFVRVAGDGPEARVRVTRSGRSRLRDLVRSLPPMPRAPIGPTRSRIEFQRTPRPTADP